MRRSETLLMPRDTPRAPGLCRLLSAPAGSRTFPALSLRIFPHVLGPLPRWLLCCSYPFLRTRRRPSPRKHWLGAIQFTHTAISVWNVFTRLQSFANVQARGFARHPDCSYRSEPIARSPLKPLRVRWVFHRFRSGPQSDSHSPSQGPGNPKGSRGFYFPAYLASLPLRAGDMLTVRSRATDGRGTFTLRDSQPCRLLRFQDVNTVAVCIYAFYEAEIASGWCGHPSGLQDSLCTLHLCCSRWLQYPFQGVAIRQRRNTRYGWVVSPYERSSMIPPRPGLSPGKKRQASLGALTID
jgi:hypothetical protein